MLVCPDLTIHFMEIVGVINLGGHCEGRFKLFCGVSIGIEMSKNYDLTPDMTPFLDVHITGPLLDFLSNYVSALSVHSLIIIIISYFILFCLACLRGLFFIKHQLFYQFLNHFILCLFCCLRKCVKK